MGLMFRRRSSRKLLSRRSSSRTTVVDPSLLHSADEAKPKLQVVSVRAKSICSSSNLDQLYLERQESSLTIHTTTQDEKKKKLDPWSKESMEEVIDLWELDETQLAKLLDLKEKTKDCSHHWKWEPHTLTRFLLSPVAGPKAESMFRKMVQWRMENNIDSLLDTYKPPQLLLDVNLSAILDKCDRDGDPIYFERGGMADVTGWLKHFTHDEIIEYLAWFREVDTRGEWINEYEQKYGRKVRGVTVVYDLKGLNHNHLNPTVIKFFGETQKFSQEYYPSAVKRIIVIRAPAIFRYIWGVVKHFIPKTTQDKIMFAGKNYLKELDKYIELDHLPKCVYEHGQGVPATGHPRHCEGGNIPDNAVRMPPSMDQKCVETPSSPKMMTKAASFDPTEVDSQNDESFDSLSVP